MADEGAILESSRIELISFLRLDMKWTNETCIDKANIAPYAHHVRNSKPRHLNLLLDQVHNCAHFDARVGALEVASSFGGTATTATQTTSA